ncbi:MULTISPECIES: ABC transporter substrate-binding protein [Nocardiopsis]|uniref:Substrate-binding region of ABC-type glycine betaine transport system n=1 Tax=Nocardiopsis dassonvillei (strain ATCC 23218 / DSM 43111 / CIP 107115 / JCM 7437 / KCTC 9190 / NBRC 14626 / NCTC 10488 / NRRL B-5397 / IMRU 509) TaxID=446468 RepID=D7AW82_NOCDD|nr:MULTISPECIES: ABC transporter substrate-binding protein [Nocardiopsis]ADH65848.1 Substrate-binding region of ABC-type glycine betaine transport system [Nocardiopsis dassonvillei subsp. dassonvillei DSM 43111]APC34184.1 glycine/betaine ABC transporter substrate-binding protein [Nocardiopsis dassonvillei]NKY80432.1 ABC transporter substrate-binding protein [Nocardiopsis dassonvillei]VEI91869.1 Osmoprotectant-binding protein [Nocardiopsis dassonvillei]
MYKRIALPLAALLLTGCGASDPYAEEGGGGSGGGSGDAVVIGSADFPESTLLAEIYGRAMEAEGVEVDYQLGIGSREVYYSQIESGNLSVFPEYNGAILAYLDENAPTGSSEETNQRVTEALPEGLEILDSSSAENKDSVTVTSEVAEEHGLASLEDLAGAAGELTLGGPPEFETRQQGVVGLADVYGVEFGEFRSLEVALLTQALLDGDIQAANLFTTDPQITANDFVVLEDPENLFGAQNITPLVNGEQVDETARGALNAVSAALTTEALTQLNERVVIGNENAADVAQEWLEQEGLA